MKRLRFDAAIGLVRVVCRRPIVPGKRRLLDVFSKVVWMIMSSLALSKVLPGVLIHTLLETPGARESSCLRVFGVALR